MKELDVKVLVGCFNVVLPPAAHDFAVFGIHAKEQVGGGVEWFMDNEKF